ncbi:MAG: hypothetical protein ACJ0QU_05210 [Halobacteriales archaeon]
MNNSLLVLLLILMLTIAGCSQSISPSEISTPSPQLSSEDILHHEEPTPQTLVKNDGTTPSPIVESSSKPSPQPSSPQPLPTPPEPTFCTALEIEYISDSPSPSIDKKVDVFGIPVLATKRFTEPKTKHVANVLAKYIDNDEDGTPDNPTVAKVMVDKNVGMILTVNDDESERVFDRWDHDIGYGSPDQFQEQFLDETDPSRAFDAALEETLHVITDAGYDNAYPNVFGEHSGSTLANLMDNARGGHFEESLTYNEDLPWLGNSAVPSRYPAGAWYTYDDETCTYECMITEYIYWGLTSILGAQENRSDEIEHEWKLHTKELVQERDPGLYNLLTDPQWGLPAELPDGSYCE